MVPQNTAPGVVPTTTGGADTIRTDLALLREARSDAFMARVIRAALDAGLSVREIHRETGLARDTIRDVLDRTSAA